MFACGQYPLAENARDEVLWSAIQTIPSVELRLRNWNTEESLKRPTIRLNREHVRVVDNKFNSEFDMWLSTLRWTWLVSLYALLFTILLKLVQIVLFRPRRFYKRIPQSDEEQFRLMNQKIEKLLELIKEKPNEKEIGPPKYI